MLIEKYFPSILIYKTREWMINVDLRLGRKSMLCLPIGHMQSRVRAHCTHGNIIFLRISLVFRKTMCDALIKGRKKKLSAGTWKYSYIFGWVRELIACLVGHVNTPDFGERYLTTSDEFRRTFESIYRMFPNVFKAVCNKKKLLIICC